MTMTADAVIAVIDALDGAGVRAGITGGWGIDALLRRETRSHGDLDLGIDREDVPTAIEALGRVGYRVEEDQRPARVELAGPDGRVDLHPIVYGADGAEGAGRQTGFDGQTFDYPPGSLEAVGVIGGREVRCGTPDLQLLFHAGYAPRDHDRRDMAALAERFGLPLPEAYRSGRGPTT
jgi:lincosamide nucleotidyltransferase A/C/D/E